MSDVHSTPVDSLTLAVPVTVGVAVLVGVTALSQLLVGVPLTYGGNICEPTASIVAVCGVPPLGLTAAVASAAIAAGNAARWAEPTSEEGADDGA